MIKTLEFFKFPIPGSSPTQYAESIDATGTSEGIQVGERRNLSIQLIGSGVGGGDSCAWTFEVSNDMTNWTPYNRVVSNVTNTNAQTDTRVATITTSANGAQFAFFPRDHFNYIRVIGTVAGAGAIYQALLSAY